MAFPEGFLWGVASSAIQIEGGRTQRGPSVWDTFAHAPGRVADGRNADVACDSFERWKEDVALIAGLGAHAYRLSISWPRVMPDGLGRVHTEGLDYYDRLIDALLDAGVEPWVTLFHWDMPEALFRQGGWLSGRSVEAFEAYARVIVNRLGDRVSNWMTLNEPQCFLGLGHVSGAHAPGLRLDRPRALAAIHHALVAHGRAVEAIRSQARTTPSVGWATYGEVACPASRSEADVEAARRRTLGVPAHDRWYFNNTWFDDPVVFGSYPDEGLSLLGADMPEGFERDLETIKQPLDFFGVNIYQAGMVKAGTDGCAEDVRRRAGWPSTMTGWPVVPESLYWGSWFLGERYELPMYITENGCAAMDWIHADGRVHDAARIDFLARYLMSLRDALHDGADVRGYFQWSILDNFEWAEGYRMRFGLVYVDYDTLERIPKDSYDWYRHLIETNGASLPTEGAMLR
jgi:beta-glucosidase